MNIHEPMTTLFPEVLVLNSTIKDRNGTDLTEAEEIKKRWQEYIEEPYKIS